MKRIAGLALGCALLLSACSGGGEEPTVNPPTIDQGRITMATVAGRDLPFFTFSGRLDPKDTEYVASRVLYSTTGDLHSGGKLVDPKTLEGTYVAKLHQLRHISDNTKDHALEATLNGEDARIAFIWEVDYKAPESETVMTTQSVLYETNHRDIAAANLAREIRQ